MWCVSVWNRLLRAQCGEDNVCSGNRTNDLQSGWLSSDRPSPPLWHGQHLVHVREWHLCHGFGYKTVKQKRNNVPQKSLLCIWKWKSSSHIIFAGFLTCNIVGLPSNMSSGLHGLQEQNTEFAHPAAPPPPAPVVLLSRSWSLHCHHVTAFYPVTLSNISILLFRCHYLPLCRPDEGQRVSARARH